MQVHDPNKKLSPGYPHTNSAKENGCIALQSSLPTCCCGRFYRAASCFSCSEYLRRKTKPSHLKAFPLKPEQTYKGVIVLLLKNAIINNTWRKFSLAPGGHTLGLCILVWCKHTHPKPYCGSDSSGDFIKTCWIYLGQRSSISRGLQSFPGPHF